MVSNLELKIDQERCLKFQVFEIIRVFGKINLRLWEKMIWSWDKRKRNKVSKLEMDFEFWILNLDLGEEMNVWNGIEFQFRNLKSEIGTWEIQIEFWKIEFGFKRSRWDMKIELVFFGILGI